MPKIEFTYLDMLFFLWNSPVAVHLNSEEMMIAHSILWKWNCVMRPWQFPMFNSELSTLSRVDNSKKPKHLGRKRDRVIHSCQIDGIPLFAYENQGTRRAGIYTIAPDYPALSLIIPHYTPLPHIITRGETSLRDQRSEIRDQSISFPRGHDQYIQPEETQINGLSTKKKVSNSEKKEWDISDPDIKRVCNILQMAAPGWSPGGHAQRDAVLEFIEAPPGMLESIAHQFQEDGRHRSELIRYFRRGTTEFAHVHQGGGGRKQGQKYSKAEIRQKIQSAIEELEYVKSLPATEEHFKDGSHSAVRAEPGELKAEEVERIEKRIAGLKEMIRRL